MSQDTCRCVQQRRPCGRAPTRPDGLCDQCRVIQLTDMTVHCCRSDGGLPNHVGGTLTLILLRCPEEFGPGLGPEYRCLNNKGHFPPCKDQYENTWETL